MIRTSSTAAPARTRDLLLVAGFSLALALPPAAQLLGWVPAREADEIRIKVEPPAGGWSSLPLARLPGALEAWFDDHFGARFALCELNAWVRLELLGSSTCPLVVCGPGLWLFGDQAATPASDPDGKPANGRFLAAWKRWILARRAYAEEQGFELLWVVAPEKPDLYPERLPARLQADRPPSSLTLVRELQAHAGWDWFVDLEPALRAAKARGAVYPRLDPHFSGFGYAVAAGRIRAAVRRFFPAVEPPEPDPGPGAEGPVITGDYARLLAASWLVEDRGTGLGTLPWPSTPPIPPNPLAEPSKPPWFVPALAYARGGTGLPRILIAGDSQALGLARALADHVAAVTSIPSYWPSRALLEAEHPDVVVVEVASRILRTQPPADPPEVAAARRRTLRAGQTLILHAWGGPTGLAGLQAVGRTSLRTGPDGLEAVAEDGDPQLLVSVPPAVLGREVADAYLRLELSVPAATVVRIFWSDRPESGFSLARSTVLEVPAGDSSAAVDLPPLAEVACLRLDPGEVPGIYRIRRLELVGTTSQ